MYVHVTAEEEKNHRRNKRLPCCFIMKTRQLASHEEEDCEPEKNLIQKTIGNAPTEHQETT